MTKEVEVMMNNVKSIKMGAKAGKKQKAEEPSDEFADKTATAYLQSVPNLDDQPDPTQDHSFDNLADEEPDQDPPPGADEEDVTYPEYRPIFVGECHTAYDRQGRSHQIHAFDSHNHHGPAKRSQPANVRSQASCQ